MRVRGWLLTKVARVCTRAPTSHGTAPSEANRDNCDTISTTSSSFGGDCSETPKRASRACIMSVSAVISGPSCIIVCTNVALASRLSSQHVSDHSDTSRRKNTNCSIGRILCRMGITIS